MWEKDPMAAAQKYQQERVKKYGRDPFAPSSSYRGDSTLDQMKKWQPHYRTKEDYVRQLATAEEFGKLCPNLKSDFKEIHSMVSGIDGIDEDLMEAMFGDHVKVVVSATGIEIEEHKHD